MTPKEKAKELVDKIYAVDEIMGTYQMCCTAAKKCALIAVDEILDLGYVPNEKSTFNVYKFYSEVKQEIKKL